MNYDFSKIDVLTAPYEIRPVPGDTVQIMWSEVEPSLQRIIDQTEGELSMDGIRSRCLRGHNRLWVALEGDKLDGVGFTEVLQYDTLRALRIIGVSGDNFRQWEEGFESLMVDVAKHYGCARIEEVGREGWIKRLKRYGFKPRYRFLVKEVA